MFGRTVQKVHLLMIIAGLYHQVLSKVFDQKSIPAALHCLNGT